MLYYINSYAPKWFTARNGHMFLVNDSIALYHSVQDLAMQIGMAVSSWLRIA